MKVRRYTVMFELETLEDEAPVTFETALRMAIRHRDLTSAEWLNERIRRMFLMSTSELHES